ncbi:NifB/NifX family molybdenum-iron cluster-binding protein [Desulfocurvus sp. DL9XJH121]
MKLAISSTGPDLDSPMDPRFGRAAAYVLYDTDTGDLTVLDNGGNSTLGQGAGIQSAQAVVNAGVDAVVTGRVGLNAQAALNQAGVRIITVNAATVRDAVAQAQNAPQDSQPQQAPYGAGMGQNMGRGMGMGPGMGMGRGRGGGGRGMGGGGRGMGRGRS